MEMIGFFAIATIFAVAMVPISGVITAGYWSIVFLLVVDAGLAALAAFVGGERSFIAFIAWSFISLIAAITIVGADIRDAMRARPRLPQAGDAK